MKRIAIWSAACLILWAIAAQAQSENHQENQKVFRGEVSDSQCALNVHSLTRSHQEMLKSKSMGGTSTSCSLYCIKNLGGEFVLAAGKTVYRLDKQDAEALSSATCGQHLVTAEDFVLADNDGVIFIPLNRAGDVAELAASIRDTERYQAAKMQLGASFRSQSHFDEYLAARRSNPDITFRQHLRSIGGAIEE